MIGIETSSFNKTANLIPSGGKKAFRIVDPVAYSKRCTHTPWRIPECYELQFVWKGAGYQSINSQNFEIKDNTFFMIQPNQSHSVAKAHLNKADIIVFDRDFYGDTNILNSTNRGPVPNLDCRYTISKKSRESVKKYIHLLRTEFMGNKDRLVMRNIVEILLRKIDYGETMSECQKNSMDKRTLVFKKLLEENFKKEHLATFYASCMNISVKHLNNIIKKDLGKSASSLVKERLLKEIKSALYNGDQSHKEIAFELGFNEPSYMSHFFKKYEGVSPSQFMP